MNSELKSGIGLLMIIISGLVIAILSAPSVSSSNIEEPKKYGLIFLDQRSAPPTYYHPLYEEIRNCEGKDEVGSC